MSERFTDAGADNRCIHCGLHHGQVCPRIKAIEYHENGALKRVEYRDDYFIAPRSAS